MKIKQIISLIVALTSVALSSMVCAAPQGGGGGGFHGGGGGFQGGGARGGGGGFRSSGVAGSQVGGARFGAPHVVSGGAINRGGGVGFSMPRRSAELPHIANGVTRVQPSVPSRSPVLSNPGRHPTAGLTNAGRVNRPGNNPARTATAARPSNEATFSRQNHIFARENGAQHRDWDRRHAHFFNGHWFCWDGAFWIGLDDGYYPWDFYPYYAYDYYPYDYYTDVEPGYQDYSAQQADPNVSAVQSELAQLGYYNGPIDGIFSADTRTALTQYQINNHLQVTGSLTNDTLQSLGLPGLASN
jgi:hypothetical protein